MVCDKCFSKLKETATHYICENCGKKFERQTEFEGDKNSQEISFKQCLKYELRDGLIQFICCIPFGTIMAVLTQRSDLLKNYEASVLYQIIIMSILFPVIVVFMTSFLEYRRRKMHREEKSRKS